MRLGADPARLLRNMEHYQIEVSVEEDCYEGGEEGIFYVGFPCKTGGIHGNPKRTIAGAVISTLKNNQLKAIK
jgi:O-acetyl-ADP-ribose deacetylase (regulator of RNase III)